MTRRQTPLLHSSLHMPGCHSGSAEPTSSTPCFIKIFASAYYSLPPTSTKVCAYVHIVHIAHIVHIVQKSVHIVHGCFPTICNPTLACQHSFILLSSACWHSNKWVSSSVGSSTHSSVGSSSSMCSSSLACSSACLACLPACLPACLLACLPARLLACSLACLPACLLARLLAHSLACLVQRGLGGLTA